MMEPFMDFEEMGMEREHDPLYGIRKSIVANNGEIISVLGFKRGDKVYTTKKYFQEFAVITGLFLVYNDVLVYLNDELEASIEGNDIILKTSLMDNHFQYGICQTVFSKTREQSYDYAIRYLENARPYDDMIKNEDGIFLFGQKDQSRQKVLVGRGEERELESSMKKTVGDLKSGDFLWYKECVGRNSYKATRTLIFETVKTTISSIEMWSRGNGDYSGYKIYTERGRCLYGNKKSVFLKESTYGHKFYTEII